MIARAALVRLPPRMHVEQRRDARCARHRAAAHRGCGGTYDGKKTIYASTAWSEGPRAKLDPPLALRAGDAICFVCHYENATDARVIFGDDAADGCA